MKKFILMMLVCTGLAVVSAGGALADTCTWDNGTPVNTTLSCNGFSQHCVRCSWDTCEDANFCYGFTCYECQKGFKLVNYSECIEDADCDDDEYYNGTSCAKCSSSYGSGCTACTTDYNQGCTSCPNGYIDNRICHPCSDSNCTKCIANGHCSQCANNRLLFQNSQCITSNECNNKAGYYIKGKECISCGTRCTQCTSDGKCSACQSGYLLADDGTCVSSSTCGGYNGNYRSYYADGNQCKKCPEGCSSCNSADYCAGCKSGYLQKYKSGGSNSYPYQCIPAEEGCGDGYYLWYEGVCSKCDSGCATCEGSGGNCQSCNEGYIKQGNQCRPEADGCDAGYYNNNGICETCTSKYGDGCDRCSDTTCSRCQYQYDSSNVQGVIASDGTCKTCSGGALLMPDGECTNGNTCPDGYYKSGHTCTTCPTGCSTCTASNTCTSCPEGYTLDITGNSVSCIQPASCVGEKYLDNSGLCRTCSDQHENCTSCNSDGECLDCGFNFYGKHYSFYYLEDGECKPCPSNCPTCSSADYCTSCDSVDNVLIDGVCHPEGTSCPAGYARVQGYRHTNDQWGTTRCVKITCGDNCEICSSSSRCQTCTEGYSVQSDGSCKQMLGCIGYDNGTCASCESGYLKKDGLCVPTSDCGKGTGYLVKGSDCIPETKSGCGAGYIKTEDGWCNRIIYQPSEAAPLLTDDNNNSFTIIFKK